MCDSPVGIATRLRSSRIQFLTVAGNFSLHYHVQTGLGPTQPPIQWVPGALSPRIKRPGREANYSPPSSAEVKNAWSHIYTSAIRLLDAVLS